MGQSTKLEQIDKFLCFYGKVTREMLVEVLGISVATASRSLKDYCEKYPYNIVLVSGKSGGYRCSDEFTAASLYDSEKMLSLMCSGTITDVKALACYGPQTVGLERVTLSANIVAPITRAIVASSSLKVEYTSGTSGVSRRILHPRFIFNGGGAWYFRAYDEMNGEYRTFRFSRVTKAEQLFTPILHERDCQWEKSVTITIAPHDKHPHPEAHSLDLGVKQGSAQNLITNAVVAGFLLNDLRVDCSAEGTLNPYEHPFRLLNRLELADLDSMKIAPGFLS